MKYTPDRVGTGAYLRSSPELRAELYRRAQIGLQVGSALAPHRTGALARSGHIEFDANGGIHHDRMQYEVIWDIEYAAAATYPPGPDERAYLEAAIAAMEAG